MTNDTTTRKKASSVFFAAIMVVSMVAVGFAAAPAAAISSPNAENVDSAISGTQTQQVDFQLADGTDYNASNDSSAVEVSFGETAGIDFRSVSVTSSTDQPNSGTGDTVTAAVNNNAVEVTINRSNVSSGTGLFVELDLTVDASSATAGDTQYTIDSNPGTGTGETADATFTVEDTTFTTDDYDTEVSGTNTQLAFQGQVVYSDNFSSNEEVQLRRNTSDGSTFVTGATANGAGEVTFTTANRQTGSDYFIRGETSGDDAFFELVSQSWEGEFDPTEVDDAGSATTTDHEIETNRPGDFNVLVSAEYDGDAVGNETLEGIINGATDDVSEDDETVRVSNVGDGDILTADFDGVENPGEYDITVDVEDTTTEATETITVNDIGDGEVSFEDGITTVPQGDIAEVTVNFEGGQDKAWVRVGDEADVSYSANFTVTADGEDSVTFGFNTYAAGNDQNPVSLVGEYDNDPDVTFVNQSGPLNQILATGDYPMEIDSQSFGQIDSDNSDDIADLTVEERTVGEFNIWTTSDSTFGEFEDEEDVLNAAENGTIQQDDTITNGDYVVHELQATGLEGLVDVGVDNQSAAPFNETGNLLSIISSEEREGIDLRIRQTAATTDPNANRKVANISAMAAAGDISVINGDGAYYIAFDSNDVVIEGSREAETGDAYDVRLRIKDQRALNPNPDDVEDSDDFSEFYDVATTSFSLEEVEGELTTPIEVEAAEGQSITGTTNAAPGNTIGVRVRSADGVTPGFVLSQSSIEVQPDGTFTADELDFSDASAGDNFTVTTRNAPFEQAEADGTVVESADGGEGTATFEVSDLNPQDVTATVGDALTITATIENTGDAEGTQTVEFRVGGNAVASQNVTLEAGGSQTVEFADVDTSALDPGEYEHGVFVVDGDSQTATLTLNAADGGDGDDGTGDGDDGTGDGDDGTGDGDDGTGDGDDGTGDGDDGTGDGDGEGDGSGSTDDGTPGFGALVALVALIAAALLATRRND